MVRSSCGRLSCMRFIKSRNLVSVIAVVAICWRKLAMMDYTRQGRGLRRRRLGRYLNYKRELQPLRSDGRPAVDSSEYDQSNLSARTARPRLNWAFPEVSHGATF